MESRFLCKDTKAVHALCFLYFIQLDNVGVEEILLKHRLPKCSGFVCLCLPSTGITGVCLLPLEQNQWHLIAQEDI